MNFENKVVLITGASSGIGEALTDQLAKENCRLVLLARRIELLEQLSRKLQLNADKVLVIKCDVSKKEEVAGAHEKIMERFGGVDIAILNAGYGHEVTVQNYNLCSIHKRILTAPCW